MRKAVAVPIICLVVLAIQHAVRIKLLSTSEKTAQCFGANLID